MLTTYKDANLYHDLTTGRSVTGILHYLNKTLNDWFSKKQSTVETATDGSEFVAAKTAIQQISALRQQLRYLGVPIHGSSLMFGDNRSVVTSGSVPHSQLTKRHHGLSYHTHEKPLPQAWSHSTTSQEIATRPMCLVNTGATPKSGRPYSR